MTNSRNRTTSTTSMDLTSTAIMLATCVFFLFGLATLTGSLPLATLGAAGLAAAMFAATRMMGLHRP
ncbi:hypothetical protein [Nocardia mangyaensis]|uniref:hypothetical protein n=1 Tax=Nocardia mangyaensis TaxID=2213200 RepID=UPI0026774C88|nr:hypothetical protein [Nocardia mangyaensis]MDO3646288.1 hypothetical protein [Nocardia mangyaensis]